MDKVDHLQKYLQHLDFGWQDIHVCKFEKLPAGWESDLHSFDIAYQQNGLDWTKELVLRIYPGEDAHKKSQHEFDGMQLLYQHGYPVPYVYMVESQPTSIGKAFMIMDRIEGDVMGAIYEKSTSHHQAVLLDQLCLLFVRLHNLDWKPFVSDPQQIEAGGRFYFIDAWITNARQALNEFGENGFYPLLEWIVKHRDEMQAEKPAVVHRDFHPNNVILRQDGSAVVIDWSSWGINDYRFDLGWTLMLGFAYMGDEIRKQILDAYERAAGERVEGIALFEVCACFRRFGDVLLSLSNGAESRGMRPEAVELMRSQMGHLKRVYELLQSYTGLHIVEVEELIP